MTTAQRPERPENVEPVEIRDVPERHRYELTLDGQVAGFIVYLLDGDILTFDHTEVGEAFEGRGLGSRLARFALDDVRARGLRIVIACPFIKSYLRRHPEYADLRVR